MSKNIFRQIYLLCIWSRCRFPGTSWDTLYSFRFQLKMRIDMHACSFEAARSCPLIIVINTSGSRRVDCNDSTSPHMLRERHYIQYIDLWPIMIPVDLIQSVLLSFYHPVPWAFLNLLHITFPLIISSNLPRAFSMVELRLW